MPRKKAEPEVLQEETMQPETIQAEEPTAAEQPALEPRAEEPVSIEPLQPYGEEEPIIAEETPESSEPEKKILLRSGLPCARPGSLAGAATGVEHNLRLLPQPKRHARHDHRRRSPFHDRPQRADRTGRDQADVLCGHCAVPRPHFDPGNGNVGRSEERPAFVLRNMPGAQIDFVITHVDREAGFAIGSRRLALASRRYFFSTQPLHQPGSRVPCHVLAVGPRRCLVECYGYDVNLSQRDMSYAAIPDLREQYHPGDELTCVVKQFDRKAGTLEISVKETVPNPFDEASLRHPVGCRRRANIAGKYAGGVFCNLPRRRGRHVPVLVPL